MSRLISVSVPDDLADKIESLAETSGKTKSELVRDALRRQIRLEQFSTLQSHGQRQAEKSGIGPEDVEELIDQLRAE
ncbi:MAG: ribbon-helix-helix protein, CopG family [Solirubrobacterales bacterium]|nr:ribbon-helix-helix protein, CopG family [Solirubrobacterales bacterium]